MSFSIKNILKKFSKSGKGQKSTVKQMQVIIRQISSAHRMAAMHWRIAKFVTIIIVATVAFLQYSFYERVNREAFDSSAGVQPVGTQNIKADKLFDVLTNERERSDTFARSIETGPVSFDPAQYDVVLQLQSSVDVLPTEEEEVTEIAL